jgi:hypothetical protein
LVDTYFSLFYKPAKGDPKMRIALTALAVFSCGVTLMAADPFVGAWMLIVEKSKLGTADIASETMIVSNPGPDIYRTAWDIVSKSGEPRHGVRERTYDGKARPLSGVGTKQAGQTVICQRLTESTRKLTLKIDGKAAGEINSVVSPDGKVMTNYEPFLLEKKKSWFLSGNNCFAVSCYQ